MCMIIGEDAPTGGIWQFFKRSLAAFLNAHGIRFGIDGQRGARVLAAPEATTIEEERSNSDGLFSKS